MRLYENEHGGSSTPLAESQNSGWRLPKDFGGGFSAMCWYFGRDLYTALAKGGDETPVGLVETNVGGTPDQHWSSPDALSACKNLPGNPKWEWPSNYTDSVLWNGKVVPLLRNTIKGAVWMQGEANAGSDGRLYNCSFQAMIADWRAKWAAGTGGTTDEAFPFGWSQLNSNGKAQTWAAGGTTGADSSDPTDPLGKWARGFHSIRLAEDETLALPSTFQAVILDTPVASGSIHSPYKQAAGSRLARGALATAYSTPQPYPTVASVALDSAGKSVKLAVGGGGSGVVIRQQFGFEILGSDSLWHVAVIDAKASAGDTVVFGPVPAGAKAVRYLWGTSSAPCGNTDGPVQIPYNCAVNIKVPALGSLSGEFDTLPLGPFIAML